MPNHKGFIGVERIENGFLIYYMNRTFQFKNLGAVVQKIFEVFFEGKNEIQ